MLRVILLAIIAAASLTYALLQHWEMSERETLIKQLNGRVVGAENREKQANAKLETSRKRQLELEENVARLTAERDEARSRIKNSTTSAPTKSEGESGSETEKGKGGSNPFTKMFQSEEGRKMMKSQAGMIVRMQFADLAKKLGLSPQDSDQLMALLKDRQDAMADKQFKFMADGKFDESSEKAMGEETAAVKREYDAKLKSILGDDKLQQFHDYEKTMGDRMMMMQYEQQFSASGSPLKAEQKDKLLQIMADERAKSPPQPFDSTGQNWGKGMNLLRDDAVLEKFFQHEEEYQRRVLSSATNTLSPDQINTLQQAFSQMREMQKLGMKMSREMFAPQESKSAPPPPVESPK